MLATLLVEHRVPVILYPLTGRIQCSSDADAGSLQWPAIAPHNNQTGHEANGKYELQSQLIENVQSKGESIVSKPSP